MFYTKEVVGNATIKTRITKNNVYTICRRCGKEVQIDFEEYPLDLSENDILCNDCIRKEDEVRQKERAELERLNGGLLSNDQILGLILREVFPDFDKKGRLAEKTHMDEETHMKACETCGMKACETCEED